MHGTMRALAVINPRSTPRPNPKAKKKKHKAKAHRSNPRILGIKLPNILGDLTPALIGAGGAIAVDVGIGLLPLPAWFAERTQSGLGRTALRIAAAYATEWLARMVVKGSVPAQIRNGALIVIANDEVRSLLRTQFPALGLSEYVRAGDLSEYINPALANYNALPTIARVQARNRMAAFVPRESQAEMHGLLPVAR